MPLASFIPEWNFQRVIVEPWTIDGANSLWVFLMGFLVTAACGLAGKFLMLRRMSLMGDAISHSVLPGLVVAYLIVKSRGTWAMFVGALAAGLLTTVLIEVIHKKSRVKQDAAIGIAFSTLFAIGVILVAFFTSQIDLDAECVLYGEIAFVPLEPTLQLGNFSLGPPSVVRMAIVLFLESVLLVFFYKELLVSSFDPGLATSLGIRPGFVHYGMMAALSAIVVSAFEAVGAILVVAMLILPGATASLLSLRLPQILFLSIFHAALSTLGGLHLATWLGCSTAAAMVVAGMGLFMTAWIFSPTQGLVFQFLRRQENTPETPA